MGRIEAPAPNRLAELRRASGLKQVTIAAHVDRDPQSLYRWEKGDIPREAREPLADLFGVSVAWLMGWGEDKPLEELAA